MPRLIVAVEIGYRDTTVSPQTTGTLYVASESFVTAADDTLANTYFSGRVDGNVTYNLQLSTAFWGGSSSIGIGSIDVINDDGSVDFWANNYEFRDLAIVIKQHTESASYDDATVLLNCICERMDVVGEKRLRFVIRDPSAALITPMTTASYDNTTDAEGLLKPIPFGMPQLCAPVLVSSSLLEYHVSDTTLQSIVTVYDSGIPVDFTPITSGFRLVAAPSGKITATVLTAGSGSDPGLTPSESEYTLSGEGRSLTMLDAGTESPDLSLAYGFADIDYARASADGGQWYFECLIDQMYEPSQPSGGSANFGGDSGTAAVGVAAAPIVNPQSPKDTDFYCLAFNQFASTGDTFIGRDAYINGTKVDTFSEPGGNSPLGGSPIDGLVVGVKVDFDSSPMTIEFLYNNVNDDAVNGPWGIPTGSFSPLIGTVRGTGKATTASIRLIEDDFTYAIPSGYSAWSEGITADASFTALTTSITDRLPTVSFDSASVNTINALSHSSPPVLYTYSYYLDGTKSTKASEILNWWASSVGGYWFINRLGKVQVGQLTSPGTSVRTITDTEIIDDISLSPDYATGLSNGIGALKNWSPYRESEVAGSATELFKSQISRDYQYEYRSSNVLASGYAHAEGADLPVNLLSDSVAAAQEADRLTALYASEGKFIRVPIAISAIDGFDNAVDEIGSTYTIISDRFGLDAGSDFVLVGVDGSLLENKMTLTLHGIADPIAMVSANVLSCPGPSNVINGADTVVDNSGTGSNPACPTYETTGKTIDGEFPDYESYDKTSIWDSPADGQLFSFAFNMRIDGTPSNYYPVFFNAGCFYFAGRNWDGTDNEFYAQFYDSGFSGWSIYSGKKAAHNIDVDEWFSIMGSIDYSTTTPTVHLWIHKNGSASAVNAFASTDDVDAGPRNLNFNNTNVAAFASHPWYTTQSSNISISEVFMDNSYIDWSDSAERAKYVDGSGKPVGLGATGDGLTGSQPKVYAPDGDMTNNLGSGGNYTEVGTISNSSTSPSD